MQVELQRTLKQQKNLADLVGCIEDQSRHAQHPCFRSIDVGPPDGCRRPDGQKFCAKTATHIDRAVGYTNEVLAYGRHRKLPRRRRVNLTDLCQEVRDMLAIDPDSGIEFVETDLGRRGGRLRRGADFPCGPQFVAVTPSRRCSRMMPMIRKLCGGVTLTAHRLGSVVSITVDDTGRACAQGAGEVSSRPSGALHVLAEQGLGLVIARELVLAQWRYESRSLKNQSGHAIPYRNSRPSGLFGGLSRQGVSNYYLKTTA